MATSLDSYFPFDAGAGADVAEADWRKMARFWLETGVLADEDNEFAVSEKAAGANLSVDVATGKCWIRGHYGESDSVVNLTIATADGTNPRIDRVILRADFVNNRLEAAVLTGTPAGSPSAPSLTQSSSQWEISLAQVSVPASDTTIADSQITDERTLIVHTLSTGRKVVRKSADTSRASTITRTADPDLQFAVAAGEFWVGYAVLYVIGAAAGDIAVAMSGPSAAVMDLGGIGPATTATAGVGDVVASYGSPSAFAAGIDPTQGIALLCTFAVDNPTNAGTVAIDWAQSSSNATATVVKRGSLLVAHRI